MRKASAMPGLDVYTDNAKYLGKLHDLIIDLQKGEVARLTLQPVESLLGASQQWIKGNTIAYKNVVSVGDIVVVSNKPREEEPGQPAVPALAARPRYSFIPNRMPVYK